MGLVLKFCTAGQRLLSCSKTPKVHFHNMLIMNIPSSIKDRNINKIFVSQIPDFQHLNAIKNGIMIIPKKKAMIMF